MRHSAWSRVDLLPTAVQLGSELLIHLITILFCVLYSNDRTIPKLDWTDY